MSPSSGSAHTYAGATGLSSIFRPTHKKWVLGRLGEPQGQHVGEGERKSLEFLPVYLKYAYQLRLVS